MKLHLGENIRENRRRLGLTQEQLADRLGVSFQSVSRWENGTTYPDMEKLPEIARLFEVTIDALVGYDSDEKTPYSEVEEQLDKAMSNADEDEICRLLRIIRHEYRDEFLRGEMTVQTKIFPVLNELYTDTLRRPAVLTELREFCEDYFTNGTETVRRCMLIVRMAELEDEEHIDGFIDRYSSDNLDISRISLLENRYRSLGMTEKQAEYQMYADYTRLRLFMESDPVGISDPALSAKISEAKLDMLNRLNEIVPDDRYPVSGNGEADIWSGMRYSIALSYAAQLAGCGEYERSVRVLEDMRNMIEKLIALPEDSLVGCQSPQFSGLELEKSGGKAFFFLETKREKGEFPYRNVILMEIVPIGNVPYLCLTDSGNKSADSRWFDPMRSDPGFCEIMRWAESHRVKYE